MGGFSTLLRGTALGFLLAFKALKTPVAFGVAALVETKDGRILLVRHRFKPGWHLPGGGVGPGEAPVKAAWREAEEEVGLTAGDLPVLFGLYTRRVGIATNVVALYRIANAEFSFKRSLEVVEMMPVDPAALPQGTTAATKRRLLEYFNQAPKADFW